MIRWLCRIRFFVRPSCAVRSDILLDLLLIFLPRRTNRRRCGLPSSGTETAAEFAGRERKRTQGAVCCICRRWISPPTWWGSDRMTAGRVHRCRDALFYQSSISRGSRRDSPRLAKVHRRRRPTSAPALAQARGERQREHQRQRKRRSHRDQERQWKCQRRRKRLREAQRERQLQRESQREP